MPSGSSMAKTRGNIQYLTAMVEAKKRRCDSTKCQVRFFEMSGAIFLSHEQDFRHYTLIALFVAAEHVVDARGYTLALWGASVPGEGASE